MKSKASVFHNDVMIEKLRKYRAFAVEYLKAAMEDTNEPQVLLTALRQIAEVARSRYETGRETATDALFAETEASKLQETRRQVDTSHLVPQGRQAVGMPAETASQV